MTDAGEVLPGTAPKHPGGRPRKITADEDTFKRLTGLGAIQATKPEVAAVFQISMVTLTRFFSDFPDALEAYENGKGQGRMSLRRRQWAMAEKNPTMAIWLGKNWLNQSDRQTHEHTGRNGGPIATMDLSKLTEKELDDYEALCLKLAGDDAVPAGDAGGDPGGEGAAAFGEEPI